jgi:hypothetical protein
MWDFYLVSTELREPYTPRACRIVKRIRSDLRDDLALVEIMPTIPRETYDTEEDLSKLVLASRHEGTSLFHVTEWPVAVYICYIKGGSNVQDDVISSTDLRIVDWGELRQEP